MNTVVIGSGTMGNGIAQTLAQFGSPVVLNDISLEQLEKGMETIEKNLSRMVKKDLITDGKKRETLANIRVSTALEKALQDAQLVIEAATENEPIKLSLFEEVDRWAPPDCILASNTSSISITRIAAATHRPANVVGMHFMNPVPLMPLVEIVKGYSTSSKTIDKIVQVAVALGKTPVVVNDYPGFISNRILIPMINEAIYCLYENVAGVEAIDQIMQLGMAHPMGPLLLADFIGLDVCLAITQVLFDGFKNPKYAPCPLLVKMVASGKLGAKSGEGFYRYREGTKAREVSEHLL